MTREFDGDLKSTYFSGLDKAASPSEDDLILGVVRYPHDWVEAAVDRNATVLGPPEDLIDAFKDVEEASEKADDVLDPARVAWESVSFRERYLDYLAQSAPETVIEDIRERLDQGQTVWLVCYESDDTFCHRRLLAARVRNEEPVDYRDIYETPEPNEDDEERQSQASLASFGGERP